MRRGRLFAIAFLAALATGVPAPAEDAPAAKPGRDPILAAARAAMESIRYCAAITVDSSGRPNARIVDAFPPEDTMAVWFATNPKSRKVAEIRRDPRVTLFYFDPGRPDQGYVTLVGRARLVDDPAEKKKRWKEGWEGFWPDRGRGYLLVEVSPERIEVVNPERGILNDPVTWAAPAVELER